MEVLPAVLIKECGNMFHDKVFIVENLPKKFLYGMTVKMVPRKDRDGYLDGTMVPDPTGEMEETLLSGIEMSPTGDEGFMFWRGNTESENRLKDIDSFIERSLPRDVRVQERIDYAQQVGNAASGPLPLSRLPRVQLPKPELPPVPTKNVPAPELKNNQAAPLATENPDANKASPSQSERMKKYWEDKRQAQAKTAVGS